MFKHLLKRRSEVFITVGRRATKRQLSNNAASSWFVERDEKKTLLQNVRKNFPARRNVGYEYASNPNHAIPEQSAEILTIFGVFNNAEDQYAHSVMEAREAYAENLVQPLPGCTEEIAEDEIENYLNKSWKALPIEEIIYAFKRITYYAKKNDECIIDEKYSKFIKYLIANCEKFTDSELSDVLRFIALWPPKYTKKDKCFKSFYKALDKECIRRAPNWSYNELLYFCDHWYFLRLLKYTDFSWYIMGKTISKPSKLTPTNLVQFMFYVQCCRWRPGNMYNFEYHLESCVNELDLSELAVISMGFFKSQTPIRNAKLLMKIIQRVIKDIDMVNEICLSAFMKSIRLSTKLHQEHDIIWELISSTLSQIPRLSVQAVVHILATCVKLRLYHPEVLTACVKRFIETKKNARLKDLERLTLGLSCFNFTSDQYPNIYEIILDELRDDSRVEELERYATSLANCLQYLSTVNVYPKDLISMVLDPNNLRLTYGPTAYSIPIPILFIDANVEIEVPDYTGPRLGIKSRTTITKLIVTPPPKKDVLKLSARHRLVVQIMNTFEAIFDSSEMMHLDWVLPQFTDGDVIICLDNNGSPLPVKQIMSEIPFGEIKRAPKVYPEGSKWLAVFICSQTCYIKDTNLLLGKDLVKIRLLEKIGYKPVIIPWTEWYATQLDQKQYLKHKILEE
ncbi:FAST kinase domain-containing protein 5, mitochondrial [Neodiprion pinetum]|uniref:FAST kinase domain-containing protein 5, mitochondrial n=1 Tax=Neodiprion pinetum TaxID=441929 RepID=UPI001EDF401C|nr:uncharacterized protein LOC124222203 [Neodiprion pinetum]